MSETAEPFRVVLTNTITKRVLVALSVDAFSVDHARTVGTTRLAARGYSLSPAFTRVDVRPLKPADTKPADHSPPVEHPGSGE